MDNRLLPSVPIADAYRSDGSLRPRQPFELRAAHRIDSRVIIVSMASSASNRCMPGLT